MRISDDAFESTVAGKSFTRVATRLGKDLSRFLKRPTVRGEVTWFTPRRAAYWFVMPQLIDQGLRFSLALGSLNGRGVVEFPDLYPCLDVSRHAMERLHQRMNTTDIDLVLEEIYLAVVPAMKMLGAASAAGALYWPLVGRNGIFITTAGTPSPASAVITWLTLDGLSRKWQRVVDDLRQIPDFREPWLENEHAYAAVLSRHAWLHEPHSGSADPEAEWWATPRE